MASQENFSAVLSHMDSIDKSSFGDDASRLSALQKAEALVQRLEKPWESTVRVVWTQNVVMRAIRIASDLKLFERLNKTAQTRAELAGRVGCEDVLLLRILRQLAVGDPNGLINGIKFFYDIEIHGLTALPEYLHRTGYRNPIDNIHPPDYDWMHMDFWEYMQQHPDVHSSSHKWLGGLIPAVPWPSYYPLERVMQELDASKPLAVGVGGGAGNEMKALVAADARAAKYRVIVQDLGSVVEETQRNVDAPIQAVFHDLFQPQPQDMQGSRIFFVCSVLHDWPDTECRKILQHIKDAMTPGYSKLLIRENVMPAKAVNSGALGGCLDLVMMTHFCSMERTEAQWRALFESVGLRYVEFFPSPGGVSGIIEVAI